MWRMRTNTPDFGPLNISPSGEFGPKLCTQPLLVPVPFLSVQLALGEQGLGIYKETSLNVLHSLKDMINTLNCLFS